MNVDSVIPGVVRVMGELSDTGKKEIMELKEIKKSIEVGYEVISENEEKAVLVIGKTGAGKSTLVNYLIRREELEVKSISIATTFGNDTRLVIDAKQQTDNYPKIGHSHDAETRIPKKCYDQKNSIAYWDCPGFGDTGGPVKDIPNAFFIKRVFEKTKYVKILLVIQHKNLEDKADVIKTLVDNLTNLFGSVDIIKDAVSLIVTKTDYDKNVNDIKSSIEQLLNAQCFIDKPSSGQELLKKILYSGTENKDKAGVVTKNKVALFKKPTKEGFIPQEQYCNIVEVINATEFVSSPTVNVTVSTESMLYAIDLGYDVKRSIIDHFDQLRKKIVYFCFIPSDYVKNANLIELTSLIEKLQKLKSVLNFVVQGDCVDQLSSSVHLHVDKINKSLSRRGTSIDVTELAKLIEHDSNYFIFLVSINSKVLSQCNPLSEIHSRMNDGKIEIEDHFTLIAGQIQAKLNSDKASIELVSSIKIRLLKYIIKECDLESLSSPDVNFVKCKKYHDMIKNLQLICKKVTDQDSSFKVVINTLLMELIDKYKLEVPKSANDVIKIHDTLALIDADDSCDYKCNLQRELATMFDYIVKDYRKKIVSIHMKNTKDISGFIDGFCNNLPKELDKFNNPDDKEKMLKEFITIVKKLTDSKNDPLTIALNLHKTLKDISVNPSILQSLDQLSIALGESNKLTKLFDNLQSYPCQKFVKRLITLSSNLESTYYKLVQDISIQANLEHGIQDFTDDIKKYIRETNSIEVTVERLEKVSEKFDSLITQYEDNKEISGNDFIKSALSAFQSLDPNLTKHFKYISAEENISSIMITKLKTLKNWLKDDKDWYQNILPELFLKLNDPNVVEESGLKSFQEITKENFREFNEDRKEQLNALLVASFEMEYNFNGSELIITGVCIKVSQIRHLVNEDVKSIKIKSLSNIFFDDDLKVSSGNLLIIAPSWHVKTRKNITIDLSGASPTKLRKATIGKGYTEKGDGEKGVDGIEGLVGNDGGCFYGCGIHFWGLDRLKINVSGGIGQDGQDGGDGATGKLGMAATRSKNNGLIGKPSWVKSMDQTKAGYLFSYYDKTVILQGLYGGKGGNPGVGGGGGEGGEPGIVKLFDQKEGKIIALSENIIKNSGGKGNNGHSGKLGECGKNGNDLMVTYHKVNWSWYNYSESVSEKLFKDTVKRTKSLDLNDMCFAQPPDNDKMCGKYIPVQIDKELFNKNVKALLEEYKILLKNLSKSEILYKFLQLVSKDFKIELIGNGPNNDNDQYESLGEYSNRFNQYYDTGIDQLLTLRLDNLSGIETDVLALKAEYLYLSDKSSEAVLRLVTKVADAFVAGYDKVLVPYNLHNQHWVGIVIEQKQGSVVIHYQDPMQELIPPDLLAKVQETFTSAFPGVNIIFTETCVEKQASNNCGPEVIENFVQYLTGKRVNQKQAVILHSRLFEKYLYSS